MSILTFICRCLLVAFVALEMTQLAVGDGPGNSPDASSSRLESRAQARPIAHTTDPLESVLRQVNEKEAILIDVRETSEWDAGHLRHAILLPLSQLRQSGEHPELQEKLKKLSKDKPVYCHCKSGGRVLAAAPILKSLGFDVRPLKAGYGQLLDAGFVQATDSAQDE